MEIATNHISRADKSVSNVFGRIVLMLRADFECRWWPRALGLIAGRGSATDDLSGVWQGSRMVASWPPLVWLAFDSRPAIRPGQPRLKSGLPLSENPPLLLGVRAGYYGIDSEVSRHLHTIGWRCKRVSPLTEDQYHSNATRSCAGLTLV